MGDGVGGGGHQSGGGGGGGGGGYTGPSYEVVPVTVAPPSENTYYDYQYNAWDTYGYNSDWWFDQHYGELIGDPDITAPEYDYSDYYNNTHDDDGKPGGGVAIGGSYGIVDISVNSNNEVTIGVSKGFAFGVSFDLTTGQIKSVEAGLGHKIGGIGASATISWQSDGTFRMNISAGYDGSYDTGMGMTLSVELDFSRDFFNVYYNGGTYPVYIPPY